MGALLLLFFSLVFFGWLLFWVYCVLKLILWPFWPAIERTVSRIRYSPKPILEILIILLEIVEKILYGIMIIIALFASIEVYDIISEWRESRKKTAVESETTCCQSYMNQGATYVLAGELNA